MDPGSLALGVLGVLPLISMALKTYRNVRTTFKTYRQYSREMKRLSNKVGAARQLFVNHSEVFVKIAMREEEIVVAMVKNEADSRWDDTEAENKIRQKLSDNYKACRDVFEEIITTLSEIRNELKEMGSVLRPRKLEGESVKDAIERLGRSLKLPFSKSRCEQVIQDLRDSNSTLKELLEYSRSWPEETQSIQEASTKLHELLQAVWNCGESHHSSHNIKLCLDARKMSESICLDLMCCPNISPMRNCQSTAFQNTRQLLVQSTYKCSDVSCLSNSSGLISATTASFTSLSTTRSSSADMASNSPGRRHALECGDESQNRKRQRRHVRFATDSNSQSEIPLIAPPPLLSIPVQPTAPPRILCFDLMHRECSTQSQVSSRCSGLFETSYQEFDFVFHSPWKCRRGIPCLNMVKGEPMTVSEILLHPQDEIIDPIDQMKLARRIAAGLLRFHATPWISKTWSLKDLCFFGQQSSVSDSDLQTLHLNNNFVPRNRSQLTDARGDVVMEGFEYLAPSIIAVPDQQLEEDTLDYETFGIRNPILYRLGVALLQIGHWTGLDPNNVVGVRQLANGRRGPRKLTPRYREVVQRCLDCDFAYGTDLSKKSLQSAVHDKVIRELDTMIAAIDFSKE